MTVENYFSTETLRTLWTVIMVVVDDFYVPVCIANDTIQVLVEINSTKCKEE